MEGGSSAAPAASTRAEGGPSEGGPSSEGAAPGAGGAPPPQEITSDRYLADIVEVRSIGSGSFGCALLVQSEGTGERFVAKKISLEHLTADEQLKAQNEASLLKSFRHANITEYLGSFVIGNTLHIIMEHCSGGSLQQAMARRERANETFDEEEVFDWFIQARARPPLPRPSPSPQPQPSPNTCARPRGKAHTLARPHGAKHVRRGRRSVWLSNSCTPSACCTATSRRQTSS